MSSGPAVGRTNTKQSNFNYSAVIVAVVVVSRLLKEATKNAKREPAKQKHPKVASREFSRTLPKMCEIVYLCGTSLHKRRDDLE